MIRNIEVFIIYTIFTLFTAGACSLLNSNWFQIGVLLFLLLLYFYRRCSIDNRIFVIIGVWSAINLFAFLHYETSDFKILTFLSVTSRMLFPYFMLKIVGRSFFGGLFNYWFTLCLLSFPPFLIESLYPDFMSSLASKLNFMTGIEQTESGGFYIFFYMHSGWAERLGPIIRNCGFMWEPGAFALVLIFMIVFHLYNTNMKFDKRVFFLILCLITTFSTAGYLALFVVLVCFFIRNKVLFRKYRLFAIFMIIIISISGIILYQRTDFLSGKVNRYIEEGTDTWEVNVDEVSILRVSRLGIAMIALDNSIQYPLGDGIIESEYIKNKYHNPSGPNSLATILFQWGWLGIIVLFYCLYNCRINGKKGGLMLMIPLAILLFSNPFAFRSLIYAIVFSVIIHSNRHITNRQDYIKRLNYVR